MCPDQSLTLFKCSLFCCNSCVCGCVGSW